MKQLRVVRRDNLFNSFFRCPSALTLICMKSSNVCTNKINSLSFFRTSFLDILQVSEIYRI